MTETVMHRSGCAPGQSSLSLSACMCGVCARSRTAHHHSASPTRWLINTEPKTKLNNSIYNQPSFKNNDALDFWKIYILLYYFKNITFFQRQLPYWVIVQLSHFFILLIVILVTKKWREINLHCNGFLQLVDSLGLKRYTLSSF